jgi:hypothetical protein
MYSIVKSLRIRGKRKSDREIQSEPGIAGDLTLALCGTVYELKLCRRDDSLKAPVIPELLDAKLIAMHGDKMLFRGLERGPEGAEWAQEWSVRIRLGA